MRVLKFFRRFFKQAPTPAQAQAQAQAEVSDDYKAACANQRWSGVAASPW
jgi:hypothetical protein